MLDYAGVIALGDLSRAPLQAAVGGEIFVDLADYFQSPTSRNMTFQLLNMSSSCLLFLGFSCPFGLSRWVSPWWCLLV